MSRQSWDPSPFRSFSHSFFLLFSGEEPGAGRPVCPQCFAIGSIQFPNPDDFGYQIRSFSADWSGVIESTMFVNVDRNWVSNQRIHTP
jgi:hypothetical protein